jgi:hypothetical protein
MRDRGALAHSDDLADAGANEHPRSVLLLAMRSSYAPSIGRQMDRAEAGTAAAQPPLGRGTEAHKELPVVRSAPWAELYSRGHRPLMAGPDVRSREVDAVAKVVASLAQLEPEARGIALNSGYRVERRTDRAT